MNIQIKRVYDEPEASDGMRILVDRLWPRGIKKESLQLDDWAKVLAPSTEARKAFAHKAENFGEFKGRYVSELDQSAEAHEYARSLASSSPRTVTLLYAAKDPQVNHAIVLKGWLERQVGNAASSR